MQPAVITVGRMNPPTRGHAVLIRKVLDEAKRLGARPILYIVDGEKSGKDKSKNPLTGSQRQAYMKKLFPGIVVDVVSSAYQVLDVLDVQGLEPTIWVAGTDRAPNYRKLLASAKLSGEVIEVDRDAGEADGVSATLARQAALAGDWDLFLSQMPVGANVDMLADVMDDIREAIHGNDSQSAHGSASSV